ncbi:MAG: NAD(P)/FAD-dependent oxidoreductase [Acidobacteria bacterium]|nr:NAD(P)/FAD-dependent oxidoreductase [Acidobacteriota bacterium]
MADRRDFIIIGGGHNGLVTAFYLARAGHRPLVLERREVVGGAAITDELHPGFKVSTLAYTCGPIHPDVARDMRLQDHGLEMLRSEVQLFAPSPDGRALVLHADPKRSAESIAALSKKDAEAYGRFHDTIGRIGRALSRIQTIIPPSIDRPSAGDLFSMLGLGKQIRALGQKDMYRLLRWGPMPIADLAAEYFETELLRAAISARGIFGTFLGPWSAGSTTMLLLRCAADPDPVGEVAFPRGGMGALTAAMADAARKAGAEIRTGVEVASIRVQDGRATGVVLSGGEEIPAKAVISNADPKRTLLNLVDPVHLGPDFLSRIRNYRSLGTAAKVNLALSGLPEFTALKKTAASGDGNATLTGRIHIGPEIDYLERAFDEVKYGDFSKHPYLDVTIPSLTDPSLAPSGKHVMSVFMQYAPYRLKNGDWAQRRDELGKTVIDTIAAYAPNLPGLILHSQVITPADLETTYGLTGGHIFHGEMALDQIFTMRPLLGWARYRTPIGGLYLCGAGTHPGGGVTGSPGANAARAILKA